MRAPLYFLFFTLLLPSVFSQRVSISVFPQEISESPQEIYLTVGNTSGDLLADVVVFFEDVEGFSWANPERIFAAPGGNLSPSQSYTVSLGTYGAKGSPLQLSGVVAYTVSGVMETYPFQITLPVHQGAWGAMRKIASIPAVFLGAGVCGLLLIIFALTSRRGGRRREEEEDAEGEEAPGEVLYTDDSFDLYLHEEAVKKMLRHAHEYARRNLEVLGFLVGDRFSFRGEEYVVVRDVVSGQLSATSSSVRLDRGGMSVLFENLERMGDCVLLGWYHSHPGYGCFMSAVDLQTQSDMFRERYHVAIVIDPVNLDFRGYRLSAGRLYEKSFKVFF